MSSLWAGSDLVGWALHSSWAFSLFFFLFSFLFPFILLIILLIFCFYVGVWRRLASPRRPEEVGRHTSPQRLKNIVLVLAGLELLLQPLVPSRTGCEEALDLADTTRF